MQTQAYSVWMLRTVRAWLGCTHPGPSIAVTAVTVLLGVGVGLADWRLPLLGLAMLLGQFSVGLSNDWLDAARDFLARRTDKPIAVGAIRIPVVRASAWITAAAALLLTLPLGWPALLAHAVFMASAWAYNLRLKRTALSVLPYVLSFGLLPSLVTLSLPQPAVAAWWAMATGALLGVAAHVANVLPDLGIDQLAGVRGLPHRIGARASGAVIAIALALAAVLLLVGAARAPLPLLGAGVLLAVVCGVVAIRGSATRLLFRLIIACALVDVTVLVISGASLVA